MDQILLYTAIEMLSLIEYFGQVFKLCYIIKAATNKVNKTWMSLQSFLPFETREEKFLKLGEIILI